MKERHYVGSDCIAIYVQSDHDVKFKYLPTPASISTFPLNEPGLTLREKL